MGLSRLVGLFLVLCCAAGADEWKGSEYRKNSESQRESAEEFIQRVQKLQGTEVILDVGCGDGKITAALAKAVGKGSVVGVDISPSMIDAAKAGFGSCKNLKFFVQDAAQVDFENRFDVITSFTVMHWVLDQEKALMGFHKALKTGGKLWIQMPTGMPQELRFAVGKLLGSEKWKSYFKGFKRPWRFYRADEYRELLTKVGMKPVRIEVVTKHERFPSRDAFHGFLKQWFPFLRPLPQELKEPFLREVLDEYFKTVPVDAQGRASFIVDRLEVEAVK
jgi:trans-aconitate 2-methyltransferase